jgi:hypothetical protein
MIKNITSASKYMEVMCQNSSVYIIQEPGAHGVGNMRYNAMQQNIEVYDGKTWVMIYMGQATISLNNQAESLLEWAKQKRDEEMKLKSLAENNKTIADLLEQKNNIEEQLTIVQTLIKEEI